MKPRDGLTTPIWYDDVTVPSGAVASASRATDVCIVGAGIAGLTTAYLLAKEGKRVVVLDEGPIGSGQTGRTSAHLASAIDDRFVEIERMHGEGGAKLAFESHAAAIDLIESIAATEGIDCDFARIPGVLFTSRDTNVERKELEDELAAARKTGIAAELVDRVRFGGVERGPAIRFGNQARFHPLKYLVGLAQAAERAGVTIARGVRVTEVHGSDAKKGERARAVVHAGEPFTADAILVATNSPGPIKQWAGVYFKQAPYRTYVIGVRIPKGAIEDALYWDTEDPYHYVRVEHGDTHDVLIVGGEDHKTGQFPDDGHPFAALERWTQELFPMAGDVVSRWSGQVLEPTDGLAFIGRAPTKGEGVFVITGDSGMGLTHGTLGARLVADLVLGRENPWASLYDPERKPLHSLGTFAQENVNTAKQWVDLVTPGDESDTASIPVGCGAVIRKGLAKLAVYRDERGVLHTCSAVCPHLKAIVQWNSVEGTWDCPAHGSRFTATGELLVGPAVDDLSEP